MHWAGEAHSPGREELLGAELEAGEAHATGKEELLCAELAGRVEYTEGDDASARKRKASASRK